MGRIVNATIKSAVTHPKVTPITLHGLRDTHEIVRIGSFWPGG
jgi:hypothetical protein